MLPNRSLEGLRVSLLIHSFDRGGSGRVAAYLAQGFADLGMAVDLTVFAQGGDVDGIATNIAGDAVQLRFLGRLSGFRPWDLVRGLSRLVRLLRTERPDVVIACANNVALISALAFRLAGLRDRRLFLKTTNPIATSRHKGFVRWIRLLTYRIVFPWASAVWTLSAEESEEMRAAFPKFPDLFQDVANPYVTAAMFAEPAERAETANRATVISVARLTGQKRLDRLIAAFAKVQHPDARLLILGEGEERAALTEMVKRLGLEARVSMPGYVNDVAAALHDANLFVLPSDYEGLPAVVLEAMASNCPVLGTDCFPAARSLLGATEGCAIIEQTDPQSMASLIDEYLDRPRPRHLRSIAKRYSIVGGVASHANAIAAAL